MREEKAAKEKEEKQAAKVLEQIEAVSNYIVSFSYVVYYYGRDLLNPSEKGKG